MTSSICTIFLPLKSENQTMQWKEPDMDDRLPEIRAELEQFWADQDPLAPSGSGTVDDLVAAMDSLTACEALERLETLLGIELPSGDLIKRGGYDTKAQFIDELSAAIAAYHAEHAK
ncbi:MAG: hypothetical protein EON93_02835 [Burkholderiales bacterium]|nr:MAG: hypothetical protein EON93_02835 [Burkholderiales bacterium]